MAELELSASSRYRNSEVFSKKFDIVTGGEAKTENRVYFGTWRAPKIVQNLSATNHRVAADEIGRPDLIAFREYGDPDLFWPIALRNGIHFPLRDIAVGANLVIPNRDDVMAALSTSNTAGI